MKINKFDMPELIFGSNSIKQVGESYARLGARKVFIVTDQGVQASDWLEQVIDSCKDVRLPYAIF